MFFFFFKQKTAYEMRISDWSSDVCSSDLYPVAGPVTAEVALNIAEGSSSSHEGAVIDLTTSPATGNPDIKRYALDAEGLVLDRVSLRAGDDIRLTAPPPQFESASVLLTGESIGKASCRDRVWQYV